MSDTFEIIIQMSPFFARSLSTMDWARSLALAHPRLADFLLHPSSSIWPWLWHQVWRLKVRRRSYKDAVLSRWAAKATASAHNPMKATLHHHNAIRNIATIKYRMEVRTRLMKEHKETMRILDYQLRCAQTKLEHHKVECHENAFYKLLGQTMLPPKELYKKNEKKRMKLKKKKKKTTTTTTTTATE